MNNSLFKRQVIKLHTLDVKLFSKLWYVHPQKHVLRRQNNYLAWNITEIIAPTKYHCTCMYMCMFYSKLLLLEIEI